MLNFLKENSAKLTKVRNWQKGGMKNAQGISSQTSYLSVHLGSLDSLFRFYPWSRWGTMCLNAFYVEKCNNINHLWSQLYKILVVLKYHRHLWGNIFDTDVSRCINIDIKGLYLAFFWNIYAHRNVCVKDIST